MKIVNIFFIVFVCILYGANLHAQQKSDSAFIFEPTQNPLFTHKYTADPAALVEGDMLWLFTGHDYQGGQQGYKMKDWLVFSTKDMKTWEEHPVPLKITDFEWAASGDAYVAFALPQ